ncbi:hypothetical protein HZS_3296, partial [Henneguya salminicola]
MDRNITLFHELNDLITNKCGKEVVNNLFNELNLICKRRNIEGELTKFGSPNTVYFGGSLNYITFIRFDDIKLLTEHFKTSFMDTSFSTGTILDKLLENTQKCLLRDKKFDYDHYCKNIAYKLTDVDYFKQQRIQILRALFGTTVAFSRNFDYPSLNELDKIIYTSTIENNFFHSYYFQKSNKLNLKGNELILYFFHISWNYYELTKFRVSSIPEKYYFLCENIFLICSLTDFIYNTGKGVRIPIEGIVDFAVIDEKYIVLLNNDFKIIIFSLTIEEGEYELKNISKKISIPHEDMCGCSDFLCLKNISSHLLCKDHFLVYGTTWCLLVRIFDKKNSNPITPGEFSIELEESTSKSLPDDDDSDSETLNFLPKPIYCEIIHTELEEVSQKEDDFNVSVLEINVSNFKDFIGASFIPYKNNCRDIILVDTARLYTVNVDTFKFGPCADSFLGRRDVYEEFVSSEQGYPYVALETREKQYYCIWRGKKSLHSKLIVTGFNYNGVAAIITEPRLNDEFDVYGVGYFSPLNS